MSVGREAQKGTALTREAYELISKEDLNFIGNVEGSDLVTDYVDVIVTDGFSGNLLLKCAESVGKAAARIVERFGGGLPEMEKCREALLETFDFNSRGAATFLGPRKTVVKMHGQANADTVVASIQQVLRLERAGFSQAVAAALSK
jgi:glycerol-3-phosphate acyltransferase PlsX